ncbi:uncharacterized protein LOC143043208 [Mytilus galloprovincialis]|uniref:uncharacterized protein LOC143043208 n=1 Tax=Mytilus galloprovincialis TaxID=29158 RepID=UPI003F7B5B0D
MCTNECCMKAFDIITLLCSDNMEQLGKYQIPSGYKRRQNIDRILFYYNFDPRVQRDYISFLQTEREFEVKYRNRYTEITEKYRGEEPKDKDWALSTPLYRAICDRKSSSSYEEAMKEYWLLCKLKEDYYDLEKFKGFYESPRILPPISRAETAPADSSSSSSTLISKPPYSTSLTEKPETDPPLFGAPHTVHVPKSPEPGNRRQNESTSTPRRILSEPNTKSRKSPRDYVVTEKPAFDINESTTPPKSNRSSQSEIQLRQVPDIFESRIFKSKPVMKVAPVYNSQDQKSLTAQNKHLRDLLQTQTDEIMSLRNLDRENQDILQNLKARLSSCTCDDNPGSVDYTMNTSSTEIAQRFINVYDNEYKLAVETLISRHQDRLTEDVALYSLMQIIKKCYKLVNSVAAEQVENITSLMTDQVTQPCVTQHSNVQRKVSANDIKSLHTDAERLARLFRKRHCTVTITNLLDKFNELLESLPDYKVHLKTPEVSTFTKRCLETIWLMLNQEPPMSLEWPQQGETFDTTLYKYYNRKGFNVNFPVWPAVLMYNKGPVLCKGFAVPM